MSAIDQEQKFMIKFIILRDCNNNYVDELMVDCILDTGLDWTGLCALAIGHHNSTKNGLLLLLLERACN